MTAAQRSAFTSAGTGSPSRFRPRAGLRGIGEDAEVVELDLPDEGEELLEIGLRLAREADDERRPEGDARNGLPHPGDHAGVALGIAAAAHRRRGPGARRAGAGCRRRERTAAPRP